MRSVKVYWSKVLPVSCLLIGLTALTTVWVSSRFLFPRLLASVDLMRTGVVGDGFTQNEAEFPDGMLPALYAPRQTTNENNQVILIRRPKGKDLFPQPIERIVNVSLTPLGLKELPAHRPPQCILLGFGKCGTSALLEFLDLHPKIVSLEWEPDYFCERMYQKYDLQWYVKKMPPSFSDQITIEKSPCYIVEHDSHLRMHAMNSSLKVMVIVRDPITRLLSEYGHYYATETYWGRPAMTFQERVYNDRTGEFRATQILKVGNYTPHFEHLLKVFPRNQVLIVDGDKLVTDPLSQVRRVETFLGLGHEVTEEDIYFDTAKGFYCMKVRLTGETKCLGKSKGREHVDIEPDFKRKLIDFFVPYNEKFFEIVGQRFDWLA
ncbi:heparan sulfate glucosamine 3-O-sulfotransferase 1-like [Physella acuta]|uniref:heparan sulfate glucosamine 3-O-sulfotransferase 1-like n=1 Tax=Physella acuta TaxID=109671 RepID=UPI0027DC2C34|nr:heparan sulfate glucosamine 3-O-sulfotransferase 1-like [Physella acuta]